MNELRNKLDIYSQAYYAGNPLISDYEFDRLVDEYNSMGDEYTSLEGGAHINPADKFKLPHYMGSLDKIKRSDKTKFVKWYNPCKKVFLLDKIDGMSALYHQGKLYSRGNGYYGKDISHFLLDLNLPELPKDISVRGELAISQEAFERSEYTDPRAMVAGHANSKTRHPDIKFYAFAVYTPEGLSFPRQLAILQKYEFMLPWLRSSSNITFENLHDILISRKAAQGGNSYLIDGIVIAQNNEIGYPNGSNPKHIIAYKENEEATVTEVTEVLWQVSRYGKLIPVVNFIPFKLNGVLIQKATGHNAHYIYSNNIGPGTKIAVVRSGEVIPYIAEVINGTYASMPEIAYKWKGMHIYLDDDDSFNLEKLQGFIRAIEIRDLGDKRVELLYNAGLSNVLDLSKEQLVAILGDKIGTKVHHNIQEAVQAIDKPRIIAASGAFGHGFGVARAMLLLEANPELNPQIQHRIHGFGDVVESQVIEGIPKFWTWIETQPTLKKIWMSSAKVRPCVPENNALTGYVYLFTGFTDKDLKAKLESQGAIVKSTYTKDVNFLVVKDENSVSAKVKKAQKAGITIMELGKFKLLLNL